MHNLGSRSTGAWAGFGGVGRVQQSTAPTPRGGGANHESLPPGQTLSLSLGSTHARTPIRLHFLHSNLKGRGEEEGGGEGNDRAKEGKLIFFFFFFKRGMTQHSDDKHFFLHLHVHAAPSPDNAREGGRTRGLCYRCTHSLHSLGLQHGNSRRRPEPACDIIRSGTHRSLSRHTKPDTHTRRLTLPTHFKAVGK